MMSPRQPSRQYPGEFYILIIFIQYFNNNYSKKFRSNHFGRASGADVTK
jgi:hypothetical protein